MQTRETVSEMIQMLILSNKEFKIAISKMLKDLMENMDNVHEQMGYFSSETETVRKVKWKC